MSEEKALALYAGLLGASSLPAAAHRLVAALASQFEFSRVSFGLREQGRTRLLASSALDTSNPQAELVQRIVGAMDEAIEQSVGLRWPLQTDESGVEDDWICIEQKALQQQVGGAVATVPLGFDGEPFGALCAERADGRAISMEELQALERRLLLAAPALRWMQWGAQPWHQRAWRDVLKGWSSLRQPNKRVKRRLLAGAALALVFVAAVPLEYSVAGRARVEGAQQRVLSAPTDGFVKTAHVRPGDRVLAGAALLDLLEEDQRLEADLWRSQLAQHENAYAAAMAKSDRVGAATSMARIGEAQAQLALIDEQLGRGRITAPFDALVIQGDWNQSIGAPVRQGDTLLTLATMGQYRVIVEVDEVDIARVHVGQTGRLALSSLPWTGQKLIVERIVPLAKAVDGRNIFEVEARLTEAQSELRPGLLGRAELVAGRMPPLWAWGRHAMERIRLAYWSWLG